MKVATFNANSIRARLPHITAWLEKESPNILCLQETRVEDNLFPKSAFEELGFHVVFRGEKARNGVAIVSKDPLDTFSFGFNGSRRDETRMVIGAVYGITIVNTYVPQGVAPGTEQFEYKLDFFQSLLDFFKNNFTPENPILLAGDFNVALAPEDVYNHESLYGHVGHHPDEIKAVEAIKEWGFQDVFRIHHKGSGHYTFWDYRIKNAVKRKMGWRIDHLWATYPLAKKSTKAWIDVDSRLLEKPSDHTYLIAQFNL